MDWEAIRKEFETTNITLKELAEKYDVKPSTIRSRKNREGWGESEAVQHDATQHLKVATQRIPKRNATRPTRKLVIDSDDLTEQQKMFCLFYLQSFNATQSYLKAYKCDYSSAKTNGTRLLAKDHIKKEMQRLKAEMQHELMLDTKDLINEYVKQAFSNIADYTEFGQELIECDDGQERAVSYVRLKDSSSVDGSLIQEIKKGKDGVSVKLYDKQKAISELMKYLNDTGTSGSDNIIIVDNWKDDDE